MVVERPTGDVPRLPEDSLHYCTNMSNIITVTVEKTHGAGADSLFSPVSAPSADSVRDSGCDSGAGLGGTGETAVGGVCW